MNTQTKIYIALGVLIAAALAYYFYNRSSQKPQGPPADAPEDGHSTTKPLVTDAFPLKVGSKGKRVEQLQLFLQKKHGLDFPKFGVDGKFNQETLKNLKWALDMEQVSEADFKRLRMSDMKTFKFV